MKRLIFFFVICLSIGTFTETHAETDVQKLGFKGDVLEARDSKNHFAFDAQGKLQSVNFGPLGFTITKRTSSGFIATHEASELTVSLGTKGVKSYFMEDNTGSITINFSYDKKGLCTKTDWSQVWYTVDCVEYGYDIDDAGYFDGLNQYARGLNSMANGNALGAVDAALGYQKAVNSIDKMSVNSYANEKKTKHVKGETFVYSDYTFDEIGNWVTRNRSCNGKVDQETNTIIYSHDYLSKKRWEELSKSQDLDDIAKFYSGVFPENVDKLHSPVKYVRAMPAEAQKASDLWNKKMSSQIKSGNYSVQELCKIANASIANASTKSIALGLAQEKEWNDVVSKESDYTRVANLVNHKVDGNQLFDDQYKSKIQEYSNKLRSDSISNLLTKANTELSNKSYNNASAIGRQILQIDKENEQATQLCAESEYQSLILNEQNNSLKESDYESYLSNNLGSQYKQDVENRRCLYASNLFDKNTSNDELERVLKLPSDEATHNIVEKRYKKQMFKNNHGKFFHMGVGGEFAIGPTNTSYGGELNMRFGYFCNVVNVAVAGKFSQLISTKGLMKSSKSLDGGYFVKNMFSIPVMVRFNFKHRWTYASYFGVGTDLNVATLSAKMKGENVYKDKKFGTQGLTISPKIALGYTMQGFECELFAMYDANENFDKEYIEYYPVTDNGSSTILPLLCDHNIYKKQIDGDSFIDKCRLGVALRFVF